MADFADFKTPEFLARVAKLNQAMGYGVRLLPSTVEQYLGCRYPEFVAYLNSIGGPDGFAEIPFGSVFRVRLRDLPDPAKDRR
jgi:hypothetical protein